MWLDRDGKVSGLLTGRSTSSDAGASPQGEQQQKPAPGLGRSPRSTGYRARSYYVPDELHFRLRNAWWATHVLDGGPETISSAVVEALEAVVRDLEDTYNDGQPFPPMPEGRRPIGAGPQGRARQAEAVRRQAAHRRS